MNITTVTFVAPNLAWGKARGGSISQSGSVTDGQRSHRPNSAQPSGRQFFFGQTSLLAPHRPLKGMLVARALSGRKTPRRERHRSYVHDHLVSTSVSFPFRSASCRPEWHSLECRLSPRPDGSMGTRP